MEHLQTHNCTQLANASSEKVNILESSFLHGHLLIDGIKKMIIESQNTPLMSTKCA